MRLDVVTLFPEFVRQCAGFGVIGRAIERGQLQVEAWNPRDHAEGGYRRVDDTVCGGGPGMVMLIEPLRRTLAAARQAATDSAPVIYLSPQGKRLTQDKVRQLALLPRMILLCGRYEGIDERLIEHEVDEELSIGDYVLSGGELAAAVLIDAVGRLQEGALGDAQSAEQDSSSDGLLDCPHYTRPVGHEFGEVPAVLLSGDHAAIRRWRRMQSLGCTWLKRPDLLENVTLAQDDQRLLEEFKREHKGKPHEQDH
ncbi:MAG TPA: tRNA (guanosine(37)-N1)-methyltransferase TrmD [Rhodanobacteraceae bacterium]|nr:tRNA (guanosine(37)-N1)-methyltransferase TrmD [Rhodanobacteraceae bacterium]